MNREGRGFCEIEFDKYVFITWKKPDLHVMHLQLLALPRNHQRPRKVELKFDLVLQFN